MWPVLAASGVDAAVGLSLGLYYTCTYFGRATVPLPGAVALGGALQYYLTVGEIQDTRVQAWLWVACFVTTGILWRVAVAAVGRLYGAQTGYNKVVATTWWWGTLLCAPGPFVAWHIGAEDGDFQWDALVAGCLRRQFSSVPAWLVPVYFPVALLAVSGEACSLWRMLSSLPAPRRVTALAVSAGAVLAAIVVIGEVAGAVSAWMGPLALK